MTTIIKNDNDEIYNANDDDDNNNNDNNNNSLIKKIKNK